MLLIWTIAPDRRARMCGRTARVSAAGPNRWASNRSRRSRSYLSAAVVAGLGGSRPLAAALHDHQLRRGAICGRYDFTLGLAAFPPATPGRRRFLAAVAADQQETGRFLGAFAGIVPPERYFTLGTVLRVLGSRGIRKHAVATADFLFSGPRQRDPGRRAGAGAPRVPTS